MTNPIRNTHSGQKNFYTPFTIIDLPNELLLSIFSRLEIGSLQKAAVLVCHKFQQLVDDNRLRELLFKRDFPCQEPIASRIGIPIELNIFAWKKQYKYAYQVQSNIRNGRSLHSEYSNLGHQERITCLEKKGNLFFLGFSDGALNIRRKRGKVIETFQRLEGCDEGLFLLKADALFYKSGATVKILKNEVGLYTEEQTCVCEGRRIDQMLIEDDFLLVRSDAGIVKVFKAGKEGYEEVLSEREIKVMAYAGNRLFALRTDGCLLIWKKDADGTLAQEQVLPNPDLTTAAWLHADKSYVVAVNLTGEVTTWTEGRVGFQKSDHLASVWTRPITQTIFKEGYLISATPDCSLELLKQRNGSFRPFRVLNAHDASVHSLKFEGGYLISGAADGKTKIWEFKEKEEFQLVQTYEVKNVEATVVQKAGDQFLVGYGNGSYRTWDFTPEQYRY